MQITAIRPAHRFLMALTALWAIAVMARLQLHGAVPLLAGILASGATAAMLLRMSFTTYTRQRRPLFGAYPQAVSTKADLPHNRMEYLHFTSPITTGTQSNVVATTA
ncbi:MAG: hypothetical protein HQM04_09320 [Magnetococcales bacterium]|nr:hypothetical protein [Magnetococcales bacterium]MBF0115232.1 hypothetical protein [Magnetococcales bacterium]